MNSTERETLPANSHLTDFERRVWCFIAGFAVAAGIYFRLRGFSTWPLATDEFYIYRSMAFVLESGLPEFPCGGYYTRGLLYQYLTVPLLALGLSAEVSIRSVTIVSNLVMLPGAFLLARKIGGFRIACVVVTTLALSTWEIEMARFGRMYAPFQAVFVWYLYHAYCLVTTSDCRRWRWMIGLSVAGPLVWEGGIILVLANLLPVLMRREFWRPVHLMLTLAIFAASVAFLQADFRTLGPASAAPPPDQELAAAGSVAVGDRVSPATSAVSGLVTSLNTISAKIQVTDQLVGENALALLASASVSALSMMRLAVVPVLESPGIIDSLGHDLFETRALAPVFLLLALIWIVGLVRLLPAFKSEAGTIVTLVLVSTSVLLNQLFFAALILIGASLIDWIRLQDALHRRYRWIFAPLLGMAVIWIIVALGAQSDASPFSGVKAFVKSLLPLIDFPELINSFLFPWLVSLPLMTVILLGGFGLALAKALIRPRDQNAGWRLLLAIVIVWLTVLGVAPLTYMETRYSFHLYPVLIILSLIGCAHWANGNARTKMRIGQWAPPAFLCLFLLSSDFSLGHMTRIDTYDANFRVGYSGLRARHYYSRFDFRSPAVFVNERAAPSDLVITAAVPVAHYLKSEGYVFLRKDDTRYRLQACNFGKMERWTGWRLLDKEEEINALARSNPNSHLWLIVDHYAMKSVLPHNYLIEEAGYEQVFVSPDEKFRVYFR